MAELFLSNIPFDCMEPELRLWIESQGFKVASVRLIQDLVAGVSPSFAYVRLGDQSQYKEAIQALNARRLRGSAVQVREDWRVMAASKAA
ncbi:MAG TPA: RNA-binding protein [Terriglobia bacterium]|nr:RNA-binding protein [Terriglobia bacterium]